MVTNRRPRGAVRSPPYLWALRPYFRQVAGQLVLGSLAGIVMNTAVVLPAIFLGRAIDTLLALERGTVGPEAVAGAAAAYVAATLATEGPRVVKRWWLMTANARIRASLRADALRGVLAWPLAQLNRTPVGDLMARIVGDVEVLGVGVREFTIETWDTVLFSISLVVALLLVDPGLTSLALLPVPAAMLLAHATGRWVGQRTTAAREANADLTAAVQEGLVGVRPLRLFGQAASMIARVALLSERQAETNLASARLRGTLQPTYTVMMTAGVVLLVWQGGERVLSGALTLGAFVAYLELYLRFVNRGFRVPQLVNSIQSGAAAYVRLQPLLAPPLDVRGEPVGATFRAGHLVGSADSAATIAQPAVGPIAVSLRGLTFRYPDAPEPALADLWLEIPAGALVAVTGPVGAGKSALVRAIQGLYPLEQGMALLDGLAIGEPAARSRLARIGYLPQEPHLFSGSIRENVLLGLISPDDATPASSSEQLLAQALNRAALTADLREMPAGAETEIGELGVRLSGGQRQRIALARALAARGSPGLLLLDDPFSAVDAETEANIVESLRQAFGPARPPAERATIVLCSHRLAAFPLADLVVVLAGGRIVEHGSHRALLEAGGLYARISQAQRRAAEATRLSGPLGLGAP